MSNLLPGWLLRACEANLALCEYIRDDLREYQERILIPFLLENPRSAAYVGMGLGKTISVLTVLDKLLTTGRIKKALIIAPVRVAVQTWPTEIKLWRHTHWMDYSLIRPDPDATEVTSAIAEAKRRERANSTFPSPNAAAMKAKTAAMRMQRIVAARSDASIHIVNREWVVDLVDYFRKEWPYDCVIVDESTSFADHKTQRFKALCKVLRYISRIHLLSGTPAPEGIQQLFPQTYLLDQGERFGKTITGFRDLYMKQDIYTKKWLPTYGSVERVTEKMSDIALVMKEEDYLPLDKPLIMERPIVMERHELVEYKKFEKTMLLQVADDEWIEAVNSGVLSGKLLQYASGTVYKEDRTPHVVHNHKITDLKEFVESVPGEPLLIAYWFKSSLARLQKAFPKGITMDKEGKCVDAWNAGKIPYLFVHPQSAGHGLNMQKGPGHILVFFDTPASLEMYQQLIKRIARPGQRQLVRVIHLVTQGTLDKLAVPKLRQKEGAQDAITDYLIRLRKRLKLQVSKEKPDV